MVTTSVASRQQAVQSGHARQRALIVQCADKCYQKEGVRKTSLTDIAREAGMTRELIYYYFSGKSEITECVVDLYVQDAVDTALIWCETWNHVEETDVATVLPSMLCDAIMTLRRFVFTHNGQRRRMFSIMQEAGCEMQAQKRMCEQVVLGVAGQPAARIMRQGFPRLSDKNYIDAFTFAVLGAVGLMENGRADDDGRIVDLLRALCVGLQ
ncbi:MAG: TetR family transcriptional regulator [Atopobiaceae bacterium]|nr:TetR family transcriptional regulator [Atopobiaceae bacterium]